MECYEVQKKKKTPTFATFWCLNVTRVALKTLEGAVKMMEKYTGTRYEHYGKIKTFSTWGMLTLKIQTENRHLAYAYKMQNPFSQQQKTFSLLDHSLSPLADNKMQSHGRRIEHCKYTSTTRTHRRTDRASLCIHSHYLEDAGFSKLRRETGQARNIFVLLFVAHFTSLVPWQKWCDLGDDLFFFFSSLSSESGNWQLEHQINTAHELWEDGVFF